MTVINIKSNAGYRFDNRLLKEKAKTYLIDRGLEEVELSLAVVGRRKMRQLNEYYRQISKVSDVLAFPQKEARTPEGKLILGDIVICYPCAQREAIDYQELIDETIWDFVEHGLNRLTESLED